MFFKRIWAAIAAFLFGKKETTIIIENHYPESVTGCKPISAKAVMEPESFSLDDTGSKTISYQAPALKVAQIQVIPASTVPIARRELDRVQRKKRRKPTKV